MKNQKIDNTYDVLIIGGGAAGIMSAISVKRHYPQYSVCIIDRTFALGRKIIISGAGRCNVTNIHLEDDLEKRYHGAPVEYIRAIFDQFGYKDIVAFFEDLGVELYVERKTNIGKVFPTTNQAKTISELLIDEVLRLGVNIDLNTEVKDINRKDKFEITTFDLKTNITKHYKSTYLILATGGKTYPAMGSNGSGYTLAEKLGHTLDYPLPSALPLVSKNYLSQMLQGQKVDVEVSAIIDNQTISKKVIDELMFTKYGFSGPAILNISRPISVYLNTPGESKKDCFISICFLPGKSKEVVKNTLVSRWQKRPDQYLDKSLFGLLPNKVATELVKFSGLNSNTKGSTLNDLQINKLIQVLTDSRFKIDATKGWNEAEFTAGGVKITETKISTLESNVIKNLYICGEVLNVDGDVGGFNLSWSWSSGWIAGKLLK